jgi:hypothetical protein
MATAQPQARRSPARYRTLPEKMSEPVIAARPTSRLALWGLCAYGSRENLGVA